MDKDRSDYYNSGTCQAADTKQLRTVLFWGYNAACSYNFLPTFRDNLSDPIFKGQETTLGTSSIMTRYGLDGPGIVSRWGRDFPHPSRTALGPTQPGLSRG